MTVQGLMAQFSKDSRDLPVGQVILSRSGLPGSWDAMLNTSGDKLSTVFGIDYKTRRSCCTCQASEKNPQAFFCRYILVSGPGCMPCIGFAMGRSKYRGGWHQQICSLARRCPRGPSVARLHVSFARGGSVHGRETLYGSLTSESVGGPRRLH